MVRLTRGLVGFDWNRTFNTKSYVKHNTRRGFGNIELQCLQLQEILHAIPTCVVWCSAWFWLRPTRQMMEQLKMAGVTESEQLMERLKGRAARDLGRLRVSAVRAVR